MDERTFRVLEYHKIKTLLAERAACSLGKGLAAELEPSTDAGWVRTQLAETSQARRLIETKGTAPFGGLTDIGPLVARARSGAILGPEEIMKVGDFLRCMRRLREYLLGGAETAPDLAQMAEGISTHQDIEDEVARCIDDNANVRTDASEALRRLTGRADTLERRTRDRMEAILQREASRGILQDPIIVQRDGRFCLPVQSNQQSKFGGLIHDRSDSGATVFMEPLEIVEIGNELRHTMLEIEAEVERILRTLSGEIGAVGSALEEDLRLAGRADFVMAKARLARAMEAHEPALVDEPRLSLIDARHPLLSADVVPITVWLGDEFDTLIITGPNTGGKTVTLKTVGLLALMAQSGLHIPAEAGSVVTVWNHVFADIGDEQSIEQSLSTFSGHMTQIVKIINRLHAYRRNRERRGEPPGPVKALVMLDELGAGTDPTEGAALGRSILLELHEAGCRSIVSTHYNDLKLFAYSTEGIQNASVQFDIKTLRPTYKLLIGHAGSSNAFEIAQRLGLSREIVRRGREFLGEQELAFDEVMGQVEQQRRLLHERTREAGATQRDLDILKRRYTEQIEKLEAQRKQAIEGGFAEAEQIVRRAEERARQIIADLQKQTRQSKLTQERRDELAQIRQDLSAQRARKLREQEPPALETPQADDGPQQQPGLDYVLLGDTVHVPSLGRDGTVVGVPRQGVAEVQVGPMRVECNLGDLRPPETKVADEAAAMARRMEARKSFTVPKEIDIRGMTVGEAVADLEKYLDDVALARFPQVRIIHGKGTGLLRRGVHEFLRKHKSVREFHIADHEQGGEGATEVML